MEIKVGDLVYSKWGRYNHSVGIVTKKRVPRHNQKPSVEVYMTHGRIYDYLVEDLILFQNNDTENTNG